MQQTTYEYSTSTSGNPSGLNFHISKSGSEPQQHTTYEFSRSVGHPGAPIEHAHSSQNITKTYEFSTNNAPNFGGSSNVQTYEISRTIGHPSQISTTTYEFPRSHERHSATASSTYMTPYDTNPVVTRSYNQERVVKSSRPVPVEKDDDEHSHSSGPDAEHIDFNHDELVDLMAEEHRHIRGNQPVISTTLTHDIPISIYKTTTYDDNLKYSTADLLKNYPSTAGTTTVTTYTVEKEKKSHLPIDTTTTVTVDPLPAPIVHVPVDTHHTTYTTTHHGIEEWSKKKYLTNLADHEEEQEETRLDYCGLCVSKRRGRKPKY